jgi:hypothetical protein
MGLKKWLIISMIFIALSVFYQEPFGIATTKTIGTTYRGNLGYAKDRV